MSDPIKVPDVVAVKLTQLFNARAEIQNQIDAIAQTAASFLGINLDSYVYSVNTGQFVMKDAVKPAVRTEEKSD